MAVVQLFKVGPEPGQYVSGIIGRGDAVDGRSVHNAILPVAIRLDPTPSGFAGNPCSDSVA